MLPSPQAAWLLNPFLHKWVLPCAVLIGAALSRMGLSGSLGSQLSCPPTPEQPLLPPPLPTRWPVDKPLLLGAVISYNAQ